MLAFSAVIGLAIFRSLNLAGEPPLTETAGLRDTVEEQKINNQVVFNQLGQLNKRILALESELRTVKSSNVNLRLKVSQLTEIGGLTTASIAPRSQILNGPKSTRAQNTALSTRRPNGLATRVGLHLATFRNPATLARGWSSLQSLESGILGNLRPFARPARSSNGGTLYKLIAGPIASVHEATLRCARLKTNKRFCEVAEDLGSPIAQTLPQPSLPKLRAGKP